MNINGFFLFVPLLIVRYPLLAALSREALQRANYFPPVKGREKTALYIYQITNTILIIALFLLNVKLTSLLFYPGLFIYLLGLVLYTISIIDYARPQKKGINVRGLYRFSRNPMYLAYFLFYLGCALLTASWFYLLILLIFQVSVHWIILSEERWCLQEFGEDYRKYMIHVRRYL